MDEQNIESEVETVEAPAEVEALVEEPSPEESTETAEVAE